MISFIFATVLLIFMLMFVALRKAFDVVPARELQRRAAAGNLDARQLYRAVAYGASLRLLLWLGLALCAAGGFVLLSRLAPAWLAVVLIAVLLGLSFSWLPAGHIRPLAVRFAGLVSPAFAWILNYLDPPLQFVHRMLTGSHRPQHSRLYENEDVLELLERQSRQHDNRITAEELQLIRQVLHFGTYKVRDILTPRAHSKVLSATDAIGPILLDELHASGQKAFLVKKSGHSKEFIGSLLLGDIGIHSRGKVEGHITEGVVEVHENDTIADVLKMFYHTKQRLFLVRDNAEEYAGTVSLESILQLLLPPAVKPTVNPASPSDSESAATVVK